MSRVKFDAIIEAVHYAPGGQIAWVRAYERRGPSFSDCVILDRAALIARLRAGKRLAAGRRIPLKASTFEISAPLQLVQRHGQQIIATAGSQPEQDHLAAVPIL